MRRRALTLALLAFLLACPASGAALNVDAPAYLVENPTTREVLVERSPDRRLPIASITKLMTVYVALQHLPPERVVRVSKQAAAVGESTANLRPGERITVRDLVLAALVQSANDAADALADAASRGKRAVFVGWMNREAERLSLDETRFTRPDGLDASGHLSSAHDVTLLAEAAMRVPLVRYAVALETAGISGGRTFVTWNDLLGSFPGVIGVKTGHTAAAGWCQVALVRRDGLSLYATILGSPSRERRDRDLAALLRYGLSRYVVAPLSGAGRPLASVATEFGRPDVPVAIRRSLRLPVRVDRPLIEKLVLPGHLALPVREGQHVGEVRFYSNGRFVGKRELIATRSVGEPGFLGKTRWYAGRTLHNLVGWI
jgi:D-alanyl-D-alanine carboxypeptidase (penicillin-binding protein 5/6)